MLCAKKSNDDNYLLIMKELKQEAPELNNIISKNKKHIKTHVFHSPSTDTYLIMIHLLTDELAIRLAKQCEFPRGFPIIWTKSSGFKFYGFHPKFKNDQKQTSNLTEFHGSELHMMLKYSGFLAQIIVWGKEAGEVYWTCTSKNSTANEFSNDAIRVIQSQGFMTDQLVSQLYHKGLYLCGELMSRHDMTHGERVNNECFVCTCVGRTRTKLDPRSITDIVPHMKMHELCISLNIPVPEIITSSEPEAIGQQLTEHRDTMTMTKFRTLITEWQEQDLVQILPGTIKHEDILGETLEGLVIWMCTNVIKYKFPRYTTRTFGIRAFLDKTPDKNMLIPDYKTFIDAYLDFWVTSPEGTSYWRTWLQAAALLASKQEPGFWTGKAVGSSDGSEGSEGAVGAHIRLAELTNELTDAEQRLYSAQFEEKIGIPPVQGSATVIVITGPIGSGKSTYGQWLQEQIPNSVHIDGDKLYARKDTGTGTGVDDITMKLGKERGICTLSKISQALVHGKCPIISCGGGVLFTASSRFLLKDYLRTTLGLELDLVVYIPCQVCDISSFYDSWKVEDIIRYRLESGLWSTGKGHTKFIAEIQDLSKNNQQFAQALCRNANEVISWKPLRYEEQGQVHVQTIQLPMLRVQTVPSLLLQSYTQFRILVQVIQEGCGHITMGYSTTLRPLYIDKVEQMRCSLVGMNLIGESVKYRKGDHGCHFITINREDAMKLVNAGQLVSTDFRDDPEQIHITIAAGKHEPATMAQACKQYHHDPDNVNIPTVTGMDITYSKPLVKKVTLTIVDLIYT